MENENEEDDEGNISIESLPPELILLCFIFLSPYDICIIQCVCKKWFEIARDNMLWQSKFYQDFGKQCVIQLNNEKEEYSVAVSWFNRYATIRRQYFRFDDSRGFNAILSEDRRRYTDPDRWSLAVISYPRMLNTGRFRLTFDITCFQGNACVGIIAYGASFDCHPKEGKEVGLNPLFKYTQLLAFYWLASGTFYVPPSIVEGKIRHLLPIGKEPSFTTGDVVKLIFDAETDQLTIKIKQSKLKETRRICRPIDNDGNKLAYCFAMTHRSKSDFTILSGRCLKSK